MSQSKQDTVMIRVTKKLKKKLKVKAAQEEISIGELLEEELKEI